MFHRASIKIITVYCILFTAYLHAAEFRNSGFSKPVHLPFNLAGSFGEPRPDHFHSGIDIKTNGVEGEPVFAIGDGYISRIRVSPYGYGKAIYITHPNGFTSVYGHLSKFYGKIEAFIHAKHYALKSSELDLTLNSTIFPLLQNDTIAFSGNTGSSSAPHLHFEIRNTKTEYALNPLDFYPKDFYVDTISPQLNKVKIYQFDSLFYSARTDVFDLEKTGTSFSTTKPIYITGDSKFCFSLEGFDKQDNSENKNGIQTIKVYEEDSLIFTYNLSEIDFDISRMCNVFVDYHEMMNDSGYFYNCYQLKGNRLSYYRGTGLLSLKKGETHFSIYCLDYNNNSSEVKVNIFRKDEEMAIDSALHKKNNIVSKSIEFSKADSIQNDIFKIKFQANSFYDDTYLDVTKIIDKQIKYIVSNPLQTIPLHKAAKTAINSSTKKNRDKTVIIRQDQKGKESALRTTFDKTKFYAETKELGTFYLKYDTTKPIIEIINLKSEIINNQVQAKILDTISGISTYNGYIDDKWVNFYYDVKNDVIEYTFDEYCTKGEHTLRIVVTDNVGNKTMLQQKFIH